MNVVTVATIIVAALLAGLVRWALSQAPNMPEWVSLAITLAVFALCMAVGPALLGG